MARSAAQFLALHNASYGLRNPRHKRVFHDDPDANQGRANLVWNLHLRVRGFVFAPSYEAGRVSLVRTQWHPKSSKFHIRCQSQHLPFSHDICTTTPIGSEPKLTISSPRLFPYSIAVGALTLLFIGIILALVGQRQLLPGIMMLGCFILFVLFLTGLIQTSIQLYGPRGSVNSYCNAYRPVSGYEQGQGIETLAYLQTKEICNDWKALFSFWIVGTVFLIWMFVMAYQVQNDVFD